MSRLMENIAIANSAIRTILASVVVGGLGLGGWYGYSTYNQQDLAMEKAARDLEEAQAELTRRAAELEEKDRTITSLHEDVAAKQREIERLDTSLRLLKVDRRVAQLTVLDQGPDPETNETSTLLEFQELNEEGIPIGEPKRFRVPGDVVYVDAWVVKFEDKYVEAADIERGTALVLFRRVFGEQQKPVEGFVLDEAGARPLAYSRGSEWSELERKIWGDFWSVANNEAMQAELGIRAAHGEAPSIKAQKGKSYRLELRSTGEIMINPQDAAPRTPAT